MGNLAFRVRRVRSHVWRRATWLAVLLLMLMPTSAMAQIVLSPATFPDGEVGTPYPTQNLTSSGGAAPYTYSLLAGGLPIGMSINSAGVLSGTPRSDGDFSLTIGATDSASATGEQIYEFTIDPPTIELSPASLTDGVVGQPFPPQNLSATGGVAPYTFSLTDGNLPIGISFNSAGVFGGTPTAPGSFSATIEVTDDAGYSQSRVYDFDVVEPTLVISPNTLPLGTVDMLYPTQMLTASGGEGPYQFSMISGALPTGMSFSWTGELSGTPTEEGTFEFTVRAFDDNDLTGDQTLTLTIGMQPEPGDQANVATLLEAQADATRRLLKSQLSNVNDRLAGLHDSTEVKSGFAVENGVVLSFTDTCDASDPSAACALQTVGAGGDATAATTLWTAGTIDIGRRDDETSYDFNTSGLSLGLDHRFAPALTLGLAVGYGRENADLDDGGSIDVDAMTLALYGSYHLNSGFFVDAVLGQQWLGFDTERSAAADELVSGERDGTQWFGAVTTGASIDADGWAVSPFGQVAFGHATLEGYTETGAPDLALSYDVQRVETLTGTLGLRIEGELPVSFGILTPAVTVSYQHDFHDNGTVLVAYPDGLGPISELALGGITGDRLALDLGLDLTTNEGLELGVVYTGVMAQGYQQQGIRLNARVAF